MGWLRSFRENSFLCSWLIWNGLFWAIFGVATALGYVVPILMLDKTHLIFVVLSIFLLGFGNSFYRAYWVNSLLRDPGIVQGWNDIPEVTQHRLHRSVSGIDYVTKVLVKIGLAATLLGIVLGNMGITPDVLLEPSKLTVSITDMINGIGVGFIASFFGVIGSIWIGHNDFLTSNGLGIVWEEYLRRKHNVSIENH